ncbi:MAG: hypothetical protein ACOYKE_08415 [Ferruginibacter sp.]
MKSLFTIIMIGLCLSLFAQTEKYDLLTYTPPAGWKKEAKTNVIVYTKTDQQKGTWCQIGIFKSTTSKGNIEADFNSEWQELVDKPYKITTTSANNDVEVADGWSIKAGGGTFTFNKQEAIALLTTFSGYNRVVSIVATTNAQTYVQDIQNLVGSIDLIKPAIAAPSNPTITPSAPTKSVAGKYAFTKTNFDDGWIATVQEDWVEVTKQNCKILIHYPNKAADTYNSVLIDGLKNAWNVLVAPKYSSATNFEFKPIQTWQSIEFAEADVVEKATGKTVHVVLFKKNLSGGSGKYIEFITPTKQIFEQFFGGYSPEGYSPIWDKLAGMANYNKFAIAASDFTGKWTNSFSGMQQYVNVYTGLDAGATSYSSSQEFIFSSGNAYKWSIATASGVVGNLKFQGTKSNGKFTVLSNWQIKFSDMEGKPKTFDAYFSFIKGNRILWISDVSYPGYSAFAKIE